MLLCGASLCLSFMDEAKGGGKRMLGSSDMYCLVVEILFATHHFVNPGNCSEVFTEGKNSTQCQTTHLERKEDMAA